MTLLASLADLKTYLGMDAGSTVADAELTRLLGVASAWAENYCERTFTRAAFTELRNGTGSAVLPVRNAPIASVSSVSIDGTAVVASDGTSAGFAFDGPRIYLVGGQIFCRGTKNVQITYTGGFETIPDDVAHAVIEIAAQAFREKEWIGFTSKSLAGETVAFQRNGFPESARATLAPYRRIYPCD